MLSTWKDIAVLTEADAASEPGVRAAAALALRHGAVLTGLCALAHRPGAPADDFARGAGIDEVIARRRSADEAHGLSAGRRFAEIVEPFDIRSAFRIGWFDGIGDQAAISDLTCDLIVMSRSELTREPPEWSAEALLFSHGAPLLVLPGRPPEQIGDHVILAWNGSREARRAVNDALPFLARAGMTSILVVDDAGDRSVAELIRHLDCHGVQAELRRTRSGGRAVADCIETEAAEQGGDLIVLGGYSHGRATEFVFGGVTRTLLTGCRLPIFVSR